MKKIFAICAIAFAMVACNNDEASTTEDAAKRAADSTRVADSLKMEQEKMMQDTNRFELSTKEGLIIDKAISVSDIVQGARIYFSGPD